jgi:hypothetical protein
MILRIFKGTSPGVILLIIITLLGVWTGAFLNPLINSVSLYETDPMPLYGLLKMIIGNNPLAGVIISFLLLSLLAIILVNLSSTVFFISERTFLPALICILFCAMFPQYQILNPVLPAAFFLIMAIKRIMDSYHEPGIAYSFFDAGIFISTGSLFYANLIWFGVLLMIGIALIRTWNLMEVTISVIGLVTPYFLAFGIYYIFGKDLSDLISSVGNNLFGKSEAFSFQWLTLVTIILTGIIVIASIAYLTRIMNSKKIKLRKAFTLVIWMFIIAVLIYFVLPSVSVEIVWITSIPVSYFISYYFVLTKKRLVSRILFFLFFVLVLVIQILYIK